MSLNLWEVEDVEEAFADPHRIRTDAYNTALEKRRAITGQTSYGDIITVIYTVRGEAIRPFSVQNDLSEVPEGMSEEEEAQFWEEHEFAEGVAFHRPSADDPELPPARERSITLDLPEKVLESLNFSRAAAPNAHREG